MKIVVVYQYYQSIDTPGVSLIYSWTQHLAELGHDVTVVTGETGYMHCGKPNLTWYRRIIRKEKIGKVHVCRTYTYSGLHKNYLCRLLSFISFSVSSAIALIFRKKPDLIIGSTPPIFPIFSAWIVCKIRRVPFMLEVRDLWPESAVQMGILKSKPLINLMTWMEKILYTQARTIIALTEGIRNNIYERGWPKEKVALVRCSVDTTQLYPDIESGLEIRKRYNLEDKKIILYFGALGEANNIPVILRAAKCLVQEKDIIFMLVGDGMKRKEIEQSVEEMQLTNLIVHKAVPKDQARAFINAANLCVVTLLDIPLFQGALPTKLLDYMACNKPVLCGVAGEAKEIVEEAQSGVVFEPNNEKQLADLILKTLNDIAVSPSTLNSFEYIKNNYGASQMNRHIEKLILSSVN